jgi:transketolase
VDQVLPLGNLQAKFEAFGWRVLECKQGNNLEAVVQSLQAAKAEIGKGKPVMLLLRTEMGCGVDFMMGSHKWHGKAPNDEQLKTALEQLPVTLGDY